MRNIKFLTNAIQTLSGTKNFFSLQKVLFNLLTHKLFMPLFLFWMYANNNYDLKRHNEWGSYNKSSQNLWKRSEEHMLIWRLSTYLSKTLSKTHLQIYNLLNMTHSSFFNVLVTKGELKENWVSNIT